MKLSIIQIPFNYILDLRELMQQYEREIIKMADRGIRVQEGPVQKMIANVNSPSVVSLASDCRYISYQHKPYTAPSIIRNLSQSCFTIFFLLKSVLNFSSDGSAESHVVEPEEMVALTQELKRLKEALGRLKKVIYYLFIVLD